MFHKALWLRNYKQGKVAIWLLWGISLFRLSIGYITSANNMTQWLKELQGYEWTRYHFSFFYEDSLLLLGGLTILLACLLIGGERTNQGMDLLFSMPFKRSNIFLSKWLIGAVNITAITLVNMTLMYMIQKITIHGEHQTFTPFLDFFLVMFVGLLAVYSLALFIGIVTGGFVSQALLTLIVCVLPYGLYTLISGAIGWHIIWMNGHRNLAEWLWTISDFFRDISLLPATVGLHIQYDYFDEFGMISKTINIQHLSSSLATYIALLLYLVLSFLLGLVLFQRTPSEYNGKIILYKKLESIFRWCTVVCFALLGGEIGASFFWNRSLIGFYVGFIVLGIICYMILDKFMKNPLRLRNIAS